MTRRNHEHWATHKNEILTKRRVGQSRLKRLQSSYIDQIPIEKTLSNTYDYPLLDQTTGTSTHMETDSFELNVDNAGDCFLFDFVNDDNHEDEHEQQSNEEEVEVEEILTEEQERYASAFIDHYEPSMMLKSVEELVCNRA